MRNRYVDLLRDALLGQHYLEHELRISHLLECIGTGASPDLAKLANPGRYMAVELERLRQERETGARPGEGEEVLAHAREGRGRLDYLAACVAAISDEAIAGDLVDVGAGRGGAAIFMRGLLDAYQLSDRRVWVADTFDGAVDLDAVRAAFARFNLLDDRVGFLQGPPADVVLDERIERVALLRVGSHDPEQARGALEALYDRMAAGGFVVVDTYGGVEVAAAVEDFRSEHRVAEPVERIDWASAAWRVAADGARVAERLRPRRAPAKTKDLGVVVIVHNMRREAARSLHSLSRSYQHGVQDLDYEVIVVENGSSPDLRLGEELVESFGPEFRYIDMADESTPSPVPAVNRGIEATSARNVGVMIDGAHVLTPGVLSHATMGLALHKPAVVVTKQWYIGPGQQPRAVAGGYDREIEDRLFDSISWPANGYRLFEIGHFIGDRDWFDGDWESNCCFVSRDLIEQSGKMDEAFSVPGGGFANLDFFERMVGSPGATLVTLLGEGSFHQVHGGTTTNNEAPAELIKSFEEEYAELRGRGFRIPRQDAFYLGRLPEPARRIKPRRPRTFRHFRDAHVGRSGRKPAGPMPVPQDLKTEFIDAFWRSEEWHRASWLGKSTHRPPTDLFAYQELIWRLRPEWIIETRTGVGGRAGFLASVCALIGSGQVLSIDAYPIGEPPEHPRIRYLNGDPAAASVAVKAREILGEDPKALVILGGGAAGQVEAAYENFSPFVPVGGYVVVEDTILEGNPVWPEFGGGPRAAVHAIVDRGRFAPDHSMERYALTFNVHGWLKRIR